MRHAHARIVLLQSAWWIGGMLRTRPWRTAGTVAGIALTMTLFALLGVFLEASEASMTARAIASVPVDWQVELMPGTPLPAADAALDAAARIARRERAGYAAVDGFEAATGETVQNTGAGKVLGLARSYVRTFPAEIRVLRGTSDGAMIAQQTAANLHVGVGDTVVIHRPGGSDATTTIAGVVDLPDADALFQAIGVPPGAAPQAPPDNVLILPLDRWQALFADQAAQRPGSVRWQVHARLDRAALPRDPVAAFQAVTVAGHALGLRLAGQAILGNNLAARLDAVRADALYARLLFLFLGAPGVALAAFLTIGAALAGEDQRRRGQALLRLRGASLAMLMRLAATEALAVWLAAAALTVALADIAARMLLGMPILAAPGLRVLASSLLAGLGLGLAVVLVPAWLDARALTVVGARQSPDPGRRPLWLRIHLDAILLGLAAVLFWLTAASGYQVVLAPEGVAGTAIDAWAFLPPLLTWCGIGLLTLRLTVLLAGPGRALVAWASRPFAGVLAGTVASALSRQRRRLAAGVGLTALAFAFAASTAIFNASYQSQALVDARLTNGADVVVAGDASAPAGAVLGRLSALPGVAAAQPLQHRYAYVGTDLQDLYGIDARHIDEATTMSDAYFAGGDARGLLDELARTPDGLLVSEETVSDFQLSPGDRINLRLLSAATRAYESVPFTLVGVVREFPTAPRDSFLVANAAYVAKATGTDAAETVLIRADGEPAAVREAVQAALPDMPGLRVRDIDQEVRLIGSSLTAVSVRGLTQVELGFAILALVGSTGLVLALGLADRRRSFAILALLGASPRQAAAFLWAEGILVFGLGGLIGLAAGSLVAWMLVKLLQGAFDPPPDAVTVPWAYLACAVAASLAATVVAIEIGRRDATSRPLERLR